MVDKIDNNIETNSSLSIIRENEIKQMFDNDIIWFNTEKHENNLLEDNLTINYEQVI